MNSEVESVSSGGDSGRDSSHEIGRRKKGEFDNINVVVRVRPMQGIKYSAAERNRDQSSLFPAAGQIQVTDPQSNEERLFTFNVVFEPEASQMEVFEYSGIKRLIDMALEGFACTVFAYGQTGSGKTFTLSGNLNEIVNPSTNASAKGSGKQTDTEKTAGLIQLSFAYLFEQIKVKHQMNVTYVVTASYLEVYNEQVLDLLNPSGRSLQVRWNKNRGFYAENLFKVECEDAGDLQGVLEEGMKTRQFRAHQMNEHSSRSHTLLTISLHSRTADPEDPQSHITRQGRLCLVDLAGSEKTKRTKCTRETLVEANRINSSLLALGNCISSLASAKKRGGHIPYRDSTLTKLLADSLSGNGLTLMVACVSPSLADASETISTLRYATRAKKVRTNPVIRMDPRELLILSLRREVRLLRMENHYLRHQLNLGSGFLDNLIQENAHGNNTRPVTGDSQSSRLTVTLDSSPLRDAKSVQKTHKGLGVETNTANGNNQVEQQNLMVEQLNKLQMQQQIPRPESDSKKPPEPPDAMVVKYMQENEGLRCENAQLHLQSEQMLLDLEEMNRENERLKRKLSVIKPALSARVSSHEATAEQRILRSILNEQSELDEEGTIEQVTTVLPASMIQSKNGTYKLRKQSVLTSEGSGSTRVSTGPSSERTRPKGGAKKGDKDAFALELHGKSAISSARIIRK